MAEVAILTMTTENPIRDIILLTRQLAEQAGHRTRRSIKVSPEAAAFLEAHAPGEERLPDPAAAGTYETLEAVERAVAACEKCSLSKTRNRTVFSDGSAIADLMFIGEAPGADEDEQGVPFVGRAGQLLTRIIESGMKLTREEVYICNVLKCRPPNNRDPHVEEKKLCMGYLESQIAFVRPRVICCLGGHAANALLDMDEAVGRLRGTWHSYHDIPVRVTYHPSYLLRCQQDGPERERTEKAKVWADMKEVMKVLGGASPA